MATYVIGDIHGCFRTLCLLLKKIAFSPLDDQLWLVGDLVNRGPASLEVLRWAWEHRRSVRMVLGNHDLRLIGCARGALESKSKDTLGTVLEAPDGENLLGWLASRPLLFSQDDWTVVHAGILPAWTLESARSYADSAARYLQESPSLRLLQEIESTGPATSWAPKGSARERARWGLGLLTQIRMCRGPRQPEFNFSGPPSEAPADLEPWFQFQSIPSMKTRFLFGHWSRLGLYVSEHAICLDSGCVHGGSLTALRLEDMAFFSQPNSEP